MEEETEVVECMGGLNTRIAVVRDACEELLMLWCMRQPALCPPNKFARQANLQLHIDTAGHNLTIMQVPSSMGKPGVTGAVVWDSGIVLAKFLEHAVDSKMMNLRGTKCIELGAGCGLVGICDQHNLERPLQSCDMPEPPLRARICFPFSSSGSCSALVVALVLIILLWIVITVLWVMIILLWASKPADILAMEQSLWPAG